MSKTDLIFLVTSHRSRLLHQYEKLVFVRMTFSGSKFVLISYSSLAKTLEKAPFTTNVVAPSVASDGLL